MFFCISASSSFRPLRPITSSSRNGIANKKRNEAVQAQLVPPVLITRLMIKVAEKKNEAKIPTKIARINSSSFHKSFFQLCHLT